MAKKSAQLFLGQALPATGWNGPQDIQLRAVQMLFDIVMVFHFDGLEREGGPHDGVYSYVFGTHYTLLNIGIRRKLKY